MREVVSNYSVCVCVCVCLCVRVCMSVSVSVSVFPIIGLELLMEGMGCERSELQRLCC